MTLYLDFSELIGCGTRDMRCLRNKTADELLIAQMKVESKVTSFKFLEFFEPWMPWIDGQLVKGNLLEFEKWNLSSNFTFKPFILGTLPEECQIYIHLAFEKAVSVESFMEFLVAVFKKHWLDVFKFYPPDFSKTDQRDLMTIIGSRWVFGCSSRKFLEKAINRSKPINNKFLYVFDYSLDFDGWENLTFCNNHSCHGSDLPYTFDAVDANYTAIGKRLSKAHIEYWSNFAKSSAPGFSSYLTNDLNDLNWPAYDFKSKASMKFMSPTQQIAYDYWKDECKFFDSIGYYF
jgi:carboxylesterase type B